VAAEYYNFSIILRGINYLLARLYYSKSVAIELLIQVNRNYNFQLILLESSIIITSICTWTIKS